jgi:hypothetical protein
VLAFYPEYIVATLKQNLEAIQTIAKERTVKTQNIEYDLETLTKKIRRGLIKLDPEYQRRHRWTVETSSKLIESLILNIPVPLVYLSQDVDVDTPDEEGAARYSVIDGQQRLTAIMNYLGDEYPLTGLETLAALNGTFYKDLPPFLVRRLEERTIRCLRIDSTVDAQVKYDIFERLNSGAVKLEAQELRNAVHRGPFNTLLKRLATTEDFRTLLQVDPDDPRDSRKVRTMEDVELVLRFFALSDGRYEGLRKGFKAFLDGQMEILSKADDASLRRMERTFLDTAALARAAFGDLACAKYRAEDGSFKKMSNFNASVYDALMVGLQMEVVTPGKELPADAPMRFMNLFADPSFFENVTGSVNDREKVLGRIAAARAIFAS